MKSTFMMAHIQKPQSSIRIDWGFVFFGMARLFINKPMNKGLYLLLPYFESTLK